MIITVSRQFGSGGRELGMRLAEALGLEYFDKQLVIEIAKQTELNENYVSTVLENGGFSGFSFSFAHTIPLTASHPAAVTEVLLAQQKVLKAIAEKGDCVIVGRCADVILSDYSPVRLFVYADEASKLKRCREREKEGEALTDKQMLKIFKQIDKGRARLHDVMSSADWGAKEGYDLMINTSGVNISDLIAPLSDLVSELSAKKR